MNNYTIMNEYTLPSKGLVYDRQINPNFKLRSMTTVEEMKRLNHSEKPNVNIAEIMDDCLVENIGISASAPQCLRHLLKLPKITRAQK